VKICLLLLKVVGGTVTAQDWISSAFASAIGAVLFARDPKPEQSGKRSPFSCAAQTRPRRQIDV